MSVPDSCVCRSCGYVLENPNKHCVELRCPKCGGEMRRREQPRNEQTLSEPLHPDFQRILANFIKQYGKEKGTEYFYAWVRKHKLDDTKPYSNQAQLGECYGAFCESFRWIDEPLISYYKSDDTGKYYKCLALTANMSMNRNDYSDVPEFKQAAGTLTWRPLNLNHDHTKFLPFPENRVDYAVFEDNGVETVIRVDNAQSDVQRMIENGEILHPSIEANPRGLTVTDRKTPSRWNYTAMALLQRGVTLPGDPLTYLEPLPLNESLGKSLVESLSMEKEGQIMSKENKSTTSPPLKEYKGVDGIDVCGQCRFYRELSNTTSTQPRATGQPDDAEVATTTGAVGPGVGVCEVATRLQGKTVYVRKNDSACTDGRVRDTPTDVDRTIEKRIDLSEIEKEAMKTDYEARLADKETALIEETQRTSAEREAKIKALMEVTLGANTLKDKERTIANLTSEVTRLTGDRQKLREEVDKLNEQVSTLTIGMTERDRDIKYYKDRYDAYERTHKELRDETIMLKERLASTINMRDEEATKRAEANQRALNSEQERSRLAQENAVLFEKLAALQREVYDSSQARADQAKTQIRDNQRIQELDKQNKELVEAIRELKQRLGEQPRKIVVRG